MKIHRMMVHGAWLSLGVHAQPDHFFPKRMNKTSLPATRTYETKQLVYYLLIRLCSGTKRTAELVGRIMVYMCLLPSFSINSPAGHRSWQRLNFVSCTKGIKSLNYLCFLSKTILSKYFCYLVSCALLCLSSDRWWNSFAIDRLSQSLNILRRNDFLGFILLSFKYVYAKLSWSRGVKRSTSLNHRQENKLDIGVCSLTMKEPSGT